MNLRILKIAYYSGTLASLSLAGVMSIFNLLLHESCDKIAVLSFFLHMQLLYFLDRLSGNAEDMNTDVTNPSDYVMKRRKAITFIMILLGVGQIFLFAIRPSLIFSVVFSGAVGVLYFTRIPFLGFRIKEMVYGKSVVLPLIIVMNFGLFFPVIPDITYRSVLLFLSMLIFCHVNVMLYDLKDIDHDRIAGIPTLATKMTKYSFLRFEMVMCLLGSLLAVLLGNIGIPLLLLYSVMVVFILVLYKHEFDIWICMSIDGTLVLASVCGLAISNSCSLFC
jgi:4-hydroxybenzoate polyprenyltransferase